MDLIVMTCRQCGGKLKVSKQADQIICQHCGTEYLFSFNEGAVSVKMISEGIQKIQEATDKTASELALVRLKEEKAAVMKEIKVCVLDPITSEASIKLDIPPKATIDPYLLQSFLKKELEKETSKRLFVNGYLIKILKKRLMICDDLVKKYTDIENKEKIHRDIISHQ